VEVNAGPGLLMHLKPAVGAPRPVGQAIVEHLFPAEEHDDADQPAGRIPVVGVAGTQNTTLIARLVAWLLHLSGKHTGLACRDGLFLDRRRVESTDSAHLGAPYRLLMNKMVQAAVIENDARTILRDGLAYDRCQVGVVTDMLGERAWPNSTCTSSPDDQGAAHPGRCGAGPAARRCSCSPCPGGRAGPVVRWRRGAVRAGRRTPM
jgi:hypothetical protein